LFLSRAIPRRGHGVNELGIYATFLWCKIEEVGQRHSVRETGLGITQLIEIGVTQGSQRSGTDTGVINKEL
jgi:hypothetical protein